MPRLDAVDLSHWNEIKDWDALGNSSVIGVIHKATEGQTYRDEDYVARKDAAMAAGLLWGAYHFLKHGHAAEQMKHFLQVAALPPGSRMVIDYEDEACTLNDLHEAVSALQVLDPSAQIAVYAGHLLKEQLGSKHDKLLAKTSLWLAQYTSGEPSWPTGTWKHWSLWQYTDGKAGGTPREAPGVGPCDCNTFNGTPQNCAQWFGPPNLIRPEPRSESVAINVMPGTRVIVNGEEIIAREN